MPLPDGVKLTSPYELVQGVLPDGLEHSDPDVTLRRLGDSDQAGVEEVGHRLHGARHLCRRVRVERYGLDCVEVSAA